MRLISLHIALTLCMCLVAAQTIEGLYAETIPVEIIDVESEIEEAEKEHKYNEEMETVFTLFPGSESKNLSSTDPYNVYSPPHLSVLCRPPERS